MIFWILIEFVVAFSVLYFCGTQVVMPLWRGTPLMPFFKARNERSLERELTSAHQSVVEARLGDEVERVRSEATTSRRTTRRSRPASRNSEPSVPPHEVSDESASSEEL